MKKKLTIKKKTVVKLNNIDSKRKGLDSTLACDLTHTGQSTTTWL